MVKNAVIGLLIASGGLGCGSRATAVSPSPAAGGLLTSRPVATPAGTLMCPAYTSSQDFRRIDALKLKGQAEVVARDLAARGGCEMAVSMRDGRWLLRTADYRLDRVSVRVRAGVVVAVDDIG